MIITCPRCAKRYLIEDQELAQKARLLRCGFCAHTWTHQVEPPLAPPPLPPTLREPRPSESFSDLPHAPSASRLSWGWALYCATWIVLLGSFVIWREPLSQRWPVLKNTYHALGLPLHHTETLILHNLHMWPIQGQPQLLLRGEIVNTGTEARSIPAFRIRLGAPAQQQSGRSYGLWARLYERWVHPQHQWTHQLSHRKLMPHERLNFEITLPCDPGKLDASNVGTLSF